MLQYFISVDAVAQAVKLKLQASVSINPLTPELASGIKNFQDYRSITVQGGQTNLNKKFLRVHLEIFERR